MLIGGVVLGIIASVMRMTIALLGALAIPVIMGGRLPEQPTNEFMANLAVFIGVTAPYLIGLGVTSTVLYVFVFPDEESRATLVFWGILMTIYFMCLILIPGI